MASLWQRVKAAVSIGNNDSWSNPEPKKKQIPQQTIAPQRKVNVRALTTALNQPAQAPKVSLVAPKITAPKVPFVQPKAPTNTIRIAPNTQSFQTKPKLVSGNSSKPDPIVSAVKAVAKPFWETADYAKSSAQLAAANATGNRVAANNARINRNASFQQSLAPPVTHTYHRLKEVPVIGNMVNPAKPMQEAMERRVVQATDNANKAIQTKVAQVNAAQRTGQIDSRTAAAYRSTLAAQQAQLSQNQGSINQKKLQEANYGLNESKGRMWAKTAGDMANTASYAVAPLKGAQLATMPVKQAVRAGAADLATNAALNGAGSGLSTYGETGDTGQAIKSGLVGAAMTVPLMGVGYMGGKIKNDPSLLYDPAHATNAFIKATDNMPTPTFNEKGFITAGRTPKYIHPDDASVMAQFIDHARGINKQTGQNAYNLEMMASDIADRYGIPISQNKGVNPVTRLANAFDQRLQADTAARKAQLVGQRGSVTLTDENGNVLPTFTGKKTTAKVNDPTAALKQEALKYKSAEEFLQAKANEGKTLADTLEPFGKRTPEQADLENLHYAVNLGDNLPDNKTAIRKFTDLYNQARAPQVGKTDGMPVYHGSRNKIDRFDTPRSYSLESQGTSNAMGRGIYVTENKNFANRFGENIVEMKLPKDTKVFDIADYDRQLTAQEASAINKALKADGKNWADKKPLVEPNFKAGDNATEVYQDLLQEYRQGTSDIMKDAGFQAVKYKEIHTSDMMKRMRGEQVEDNVSYVLFDEKLANDNFTKPEVTPQVGKTDPLEALKAEARKYKSAEEFTQAIQDGKVSIPKGSPEQIAAIQKQLGMNWDEAYKTPTGVYDMQKKVANDLYNQAIAPQPKSSPIGKDVRPEAPQVGKTDTYTYPNGMKVSAGYKVLEDKIDAISDKTMALAKEKVEIESNIKSQADLDKAKPKIEKIVKEYDKLRAEQEELRTKKNALARTPTTTPPQVGKTDPLKAAEARTNQGLSELSDIRKQYANDQEFFDKVILENIEAKGEIGDFARHIARRDAQEGSIYNKNYLTEILDDELAPINSNLDQAINKTAQREELARTIRQFEKSSGQKGLYQKVAQSMQGMTEQEQIDYMGKALTKMRDDGFLAADFLNKQNGYTPKAKPTQKPQQQLPPPAQVGKTSPVENTPKTLYRGTTKREVDALLAGKQKPESLETNIFGETIPKNTLFVTDDINLAKNYSERAAVTRKPHLDGGYIIEYKNTANTKAQSSISKEAGSSVVQQNPNEFYAKDLTLDDVARITDKDGNVVYDASTPRQKPAPRQTDDIVKNGGQGAFYTDPKTGKQTYITEDELLEELIRLQSIPVAQRTGADATSLADIRKVLNKNRADANTTPPAQVGKTGATSQSAKANQKIVQPLVDTEMAQNPKSITPKTGLGEQFPANQTSSRTNAASYSDNTPLTGDKLDAKSYQKVFDVDEKTAQLDLDPNRPATVSTKPKNMKKILDAMEADSKFTKARKEAQNSGKEFNFYAKTDQSGRSVGIEQFNPKNHRIESGFVVDSDGRMLGNHIKIDETGTQINIGGELVNMNNVFGDVGKWGDKYRVSETLERNIMSNAPDEKTGRNVYNWLIHHKNKSEASMKTAAKAAIDTNKIRRNEVMSAKPFSANKKEYLADTMAYGENRIKYGELASKYGTNAANAIKKNIDAMRKDYDTYLDNINEVRVRFGKEPIQKRKDYITHINELNNSNGFVGEVTDNLRNGIMGEGMQRTRSGVPADIAGRTENFKPTSKWNPFLQHRKGGEFTEDPFKAFEAYVVPAEHNIHMTESVARARAVEEFFRANKSLSNMNQENYGKLLSEELSNKVASGKDGKLVTAFQEYANALAGKTQRWDRQIIDASKASEMGLRGWQWTQRVAGRATIPGNIKSVLMQPLNQLNVMSQVKTGSYFKGIGRWLTGDKAIDQSPFLKARKTYIDSAYQGKLDKFADKAGVPMQKVELESVKLAWMAQYEDVLRKGFKGKQAIAEADRLTERAVAGRGLADKPELYRSTATNGILQYTLEVMAQSKVFWKDLTPTQKAKWIAGAYAINTGIAFVANDRPLPDYINAAVQSYGDFADPEDKRSGAEKTLGTAQRFGTETIKFNPVLSMGAKFLPDDTKRTLFGSDSELTRYDGSFAPMRVFSNTKEAGQALAQGNVIEARNKMLKNFPAGNQAEKTITDFEMLARGYDINNKGERTFDAPSGIVDKGRALIFGPNASDAANNYYEDKKKATVSKTTKTSSAQNPQLSLDDQRTEAKNTIKKLYGKEWASMSESDIENKARNGDQKALEIYNSLQAQEKVYAKPNMPTPGLSKDAEDILNSEKKFTTTGRKAWGNRPTESKVVKETLKSWTGLDLPVTNDVAVEWAKFKQKQAKGEFSPLEENEAKLSLARKAVSSQLSEDERQYYNVADDKLLDALSKGWIKPDSLAKAMDIDKQLLSMGLTSKSGFGKKIWNALGIAYPSVSGASSGTRRSSGRRSTRTAKAPKLKFTTTRVKNRQKSFNSSLRKLLASAKV